MTNKYSFLFLFLLTSILSYADDDAVGSGGWFLGPTTVDARSAAMGRTAITSVQGSNGLFSNPAILGTLSKRQFQAGGRLIMGSITNDGANEDNGVKSYDHSLTPHIGIDHLSFSTPIEINEEDVKLNVGIGFGRYFDNGMKGEVTYENTNGDKTTREYSYGGGLFVLAPSGGISFQDKYFVGLSINKSILSDVTSDYNAKEISQNGDETKYEGSSEQPTSATFFQLGGLAKITPEFSAGFVYRPEFEWQFEKGKWKSKSGDNEDNGDIDKYKLTIPGLFGLGATYKISDKMEVAGEYQTRGWSEVKFDGDTPNNTLQDGSSYRLGGEYTAGQVQLRLGYFTDDIYMTNQVENNDDVPLSLSGITGGFGYTKNNFTIDGYAELASFAYDYKDSKTYTVEPFAKDNFFLSDRKQAIFFDGNKAS